MKSRLLNNPAFTRVSPFIVFMTFIAVEEGLRSLLRHQVITFDDTALYWLYLPKAFLVGFMLFLFRHRVPEIMVRDFGDYLKTAVSVLSGVLVFYLWIKMDWTLGSQHTPAGFDPGIFKEDPVKLLMVTARVTGAVIIVPIMEELFWRSFLLRYLIDSNFTSVAIGRFSLFSFLAVSILFGLEHHYVFAGIMAGVIFNGIYYYTRSIAQCILSHATANLCLAYYVLTTGQWHFW